MPLSVDYRLGVDVSQGMSSLTSLQSKMKDVGNTARNELAQKLKTVFEVTAIEEAIRRTSQWALEIQQTSKQMGISAEALQTLQTIAGKTGLPTDAVTEMFENIAKAREQALAGNQELIISFQNLGVTLSDLMSTTKSELFGKVLKNLPANIQNANMMLRQSAAQITGNTPENYINGITTETGGNFAGYQAQQKASGAVLPEKTMSELAATWADIIQDLKEAGNQLKPAVVPLLGVIKTLTSALAGLAQQIHNNFDLAIGLLTGDKEKIKKSVSNTGGLLANVGIGLLKTGISVGDSINRTVIGSGLTGNFYSDLLTKYLGNSQKTLGISKSTQERGQSLGNAALLIGPSGIEAGVGKLGAGVDVAAGIIKKGVVTSAKDAAKSLVKDVAKGEAVPPKSIYNSGDINPMGAKLTKKQFMENQVFGLRGVRGIGIGKSISGNAFLSNILGAVNSLNNVNQGTAPSEIKPIVPNVGVFAGVGGNGSNPMLKMGGTFGSGFQSRLIRLNEEMVKYLAQISQYMSFMNSPVGNNSTNPNLPPGL